MYIIAFRYGRGEEYSIYGQYDSLEDAKNELFDKELASFLRYGPDDISNLHLLELDEEGTKKFKSYIASGKSLEDYEFVNFMNEIYNNHSTSLWNMIVADGIDYITDLAKKDGIKPNKLYKDNKLFEKYLDEYIKQLKNEYK